MQPPPFARHEPNGPFWPGCSDHRLLRLLVSVLAAWAVGMPLAAALLKWWFKRAIVPSVQLVEEAQALLTTNGVHRLQLRGQDHARSIHAVIERERLARWPAFVIAWSEVPSGPQPILKWPPQRGSFCGWAWRRRVKRSRPARTVQRPLNHLKFLAWLNGAPS